LPHKPVDQDERESLNNFDSPRNRLNNEENQLMTLVASGLPAPEVAQRLGLEEAELAERIRTVQSKIAKTGKAHAALSGLRQALREGGGR
jgi:DNA-binding NarL/FixJ family response regulator